MSIFLESAVKQFSYYKMVAEKAILQVPDDALFWQYNSESNSIAMIVKHIWGNMLSRWTDFLTTDGEKEWRQRDAEFENDLRSREEVMQKWNSGWQCLFNALQNLTEGDLDKEVFIRNQGQTAIDAINRQIAHYGYHVGQIVYLAKMVCDENWTSLSIPKGKSVAYNAAKFEKPKHKEHFTDEYLKNKRPEN